MDSGHMEIHRAVPEDALALTRIAFEAKRHWGYPEKWIESWSGSLTIHADFIASQETWKAVGELGIAGFYALAARSGELELEHLWVLPGAMGQGIGRELFVHAMECARRLAFGSVQIESDSNAEGFYLHMGARRVGRIAKPVGGEMRELPMLRFELGI